MAVNDIPCHALDRCDDGNPWKICRHLWMSPHCFYCSEITPLGIDHNLPRVCSRYDACRFPTIQFGDDVIRVLTQKFEQPWLVFRLDSKDIDESGDLFDHSDRWMQGVLQKRYSIPSMKTTQRTQTNRCPGKKTQTPAGSSDQATAGECHHNL